MQKTIHEEASRLIHHPKVAAWIKQIRFEQEEVRRMHLLANEEAILDQLRFEVMNAKTDSTRIKALELLGRHLGMFHDRIEVEQVARNADEIELT